MSNLTTEQKGKIIGDIIGVLKSEAFLRGDHNFCAGDTFFSLAFKSDKELMKIASLTGVAAPLAA